MSEQQRNEQQIRCDVVTPASRRFQRRVLVATVCYLVAVLGGVELARHVALRPWELYTIAGIAAGPLIAVLAAVAMYLQEERDEYVRWMTVRSLLVGTGAVMSVLVVNDLLRSIAHRTELPPFACFVIFFVGFGLAQFMQQRANRRDSNE